MTRLNPSSLLFAALAFSQACIALVSAAELKTGGWYMIQQSPFSFGVNIANNRKGYNVTAVKEGGAIWILERGSSEGLFALKGLFSRRYLTFPEPAVENSVVGMTHKSSDLRLENAEKGTDKYRISPPSATSLTIQKSADTVELVLKPKSDQQPGADEWLFFELKKTFP